MPTFEKHRKRRVLYNDDADQQYTGYKVYSYGVTDEQSFLDARPMDRAGPPTRSA